MDHSESMRSPTATVAGGKVRVSIQVNRPIEVAWLALSDPARVGKWFGELDQPWLVGRTGRIEFGDGDFFVVTATELVEYKLIEFEWSFLGVGPVERIRWILNAIPAGAEIVVEDHDPDRAPAEVDQMVAGWTDFFERLGRYLATGESSRYEWREDIDGSVELPDGDFAPLEADVLYRWLPIAIDGFQPRWFFIVDDDGPRRFRVDDWSVESGHELSFSVEIPDADADTLCTVAVDQAGRGRRLRFSHTGWRALGLPDNRSRALRRRFAMTWVAALKQARGMAAASDNS